MPLSSGTQLGRYKLLSPLGAGGMGEVYRAKDLLLQRDVAIKILPAHLLSNTDAQKRFQREARVLASISHPNILPIHDFGIEGGIPFAVMDLLEGKTLRELLKQKAGFPWEQASKVGIAIAEGLSAAHGRGVIHRDLKPENIFITKDDRVIILDFGLARMDSRPFQEAASSLQTKSLETQEGTLLGTVPYMSPEQLQGLTVDSRTDIFSFGCVLYEMLTGTRAFARNSSAEIVAAILKEDPPELSRSRMIPEKVLIVIGGCLEKEREKRIQSSQDLVFLLRDSFNDSMTQRGKETPRRFSTLTWIGILLVLVFTVATGYWWIQKTRKLESGGKIQSLAVLPLKNLSGNQEQEYFADGMTEAMIAQLAKIRALKIISRTSVMQYKDSTKPLRSIGEELQVDAVIEGSVLQSGGRVRITAQLFDARTDQNLWAETYERDISNVLALQGEIATDITKQIRIEITSEEQSRLASNETLSAEGYEAYLKGRYFWNKRTTNGMKKAVEYFQKTLDLDPTYAPAYVGLADCYIVQSGKLLGLPGREAYARAKTAITRALEINDTLAEAHTSLGSITGEYDHDWQAAEKEYLRAIELNPNYATAHQWYSDFLVINGRPQEALVQARRALELDPLSLVIHTTVGVRLYALGNYDQAVQHFKKTLEMDTNFLGAYFFLGRTYLQLGKYKEAEESFQNVGATAYIGYTYAASGRKEEARRILRDLADQSVEQYVNPFDLTILHIGLGDVDGAFKWLDKAYADNMEEVLFLKMDPLVDPLRSDARFSDLLKRLNLE